MTPRRRPRGRRQFSHLYHHRHVSSFINEFPLTDDSLHGGRVGGHVDGLVMRVMRADSLDLASRLEGLDFVADQFFLSHFAILPSISFRVESRARFPSLSRRVDLWGKGRLDSPYMNSTR